MRLPWEHVFENEFPWTLVCGDSSLVLAELPDESVDSAVMDPPSGIAFMGKAWDDPRGGRDSWVAWLAGILGHVHRVLKPGGHALVWALPRTSHWTATAVEDSGLEIRDRIHDLAAIDNGLAVFWASLGDEQREALGRIIDAQASPILYHLFGSGFPKSMDVPKATAKAMGVKPSKVEPADLGMAHNPQWNELKHKLTMPPLEEWPPEVQDAARPWVGWGTALKPATEHWILCRKPLAESSVVANIQAHGVGAINLDACRVGTNAGWSYPHGRGGQGWHGRESLSQNLEEPIKATKGRHPPHLVLEHAPGCRIVGERAVRSGTAVRGKSGGNTFGGENAKPPMEDMTYGEGGRETVPAWECVPGCPVAELDDQSAVGGMHGAGASRGGGLGTGENDSLFRGKGRPDPSNGTRYGDKGGASRFFPTFCYAAKPSRKEKNAGCDDLPEREWREGAANCTPRSGQIYEQMGRCGAPRKNNHPTVKALKLMRWLVSLVTPAGGVVLDPFTGSGSTGVAALELGMRFIGVEQSMDYAAIADARLRHAHPPAQTTATVEDVMLEGFV